MLTIKFKNAPKLIPGYFVEVVADLFSTLQKRTEADLKKAGPDTPLTSFSGM